jgi:hypothetical protein
MAFTDKLAQMAEYAAQVHDVVDKEIELVELPKWTNGQDGSNLTVKTRMGSQVVIQPERAAETRDGGWWFLHIQRADGRNIGLPVGRFTPELYFDAKPVEQLYVEKTFTREQKKFTAEVAGDVIEWQPITQEVTIHPNGRVELGDFTTHFGALAFANIGRAKGETSPLLGVVPTDSKNGFKIVEGHLVVPRLERVVGISEPRRFAAEWNEERKMLIVYLDGVTAAT